MSDVLKKYLTDMMKAAMEIEEFVGEKRNFKRFQRSAMLRAAVERKLEIIGEAMNEALKLENDLPLLTTPYFSPETLLSSHPLPTLPQI